jgi:hypothetical protein
MAASVVASLAPIGNVGFVIGGDYIPPDAVISSALYDGVRDSSSSCLVSSYWGMTGSDYLPSRSFSGRPWYDINFVGSWAETAGLVPAQYGLGTPVMCLESLYEYNTPYGFNRAINRRNFLSSVLNGASGAVYGNEYTWFFDSTDFPNAWESHPGHSYTEYLNDPGCMDHARIGSMLNSLRWYDLIPDTSNLLVTSAKGSGASYVAAARTSDGRLSLVYSPTSTPFTVNLAQMSGTMTAQWWDPITNLYSNAGAGSYANTGSQSFTPPGNSDSTDSLLILAVP